MRGQPPQGRGFRPQSTSLWEGPHRNRPLLPPYFVAAPYKVRILKQYEDSETLDTAVAGASAGQPSDSSVGVPWVGASDRVNAYDISFQRARGGVFVRTYNQDKTSAKDKYVTFSVNMDSDLYVFLSETDFSPVVRGAAQAPSPPLIAHGDSPHSPGAAQGAQLAGSRHRSRRAVPRLRRVELHHCGVLAPKQRVAGRKL